MEFRIEEKKAFTVVGISRHFALEDCAMPEFQSSGMRS